MDGFGINTDHEQPENESADAHYVWQYCCRSGAVKGRSKQVRCMRSCHTQWLLLLAPATDNLKLRSFACHDQQRRRRPAGPPHADAASVMLL